jgi:hypothetical protein
MKIKFAKNYSTYRIGDVVDCDPDVAQRLIADGRAIPDRQMDLIETAAIDPGGEQAAVTPKRRGRLPKVSTDALPQRDGPDAADG